MNTSPSAYYQTRTFSITLGGQAIKIISKPGIPDWDSVSPAQQLLADAVKPTADARMLLLGCGPGALGVALARQAQAGSATLLDSSWIALAMAERTLSANNVANARICPTISVLPEQAGAFDIALIVVPNDRKLTRRWLVEAYAALRPGGELYIAGANDHGIRSVIGDAEALFGSAHVLGYKHGNRVAQARKAIDVKDLPGWAGEPVSRPAPGTSSRRRRAGIRFICAACPACSPMIAWMPARRCCWRCWRSQPGARVLDVGCGYGIIGLAAARLGAAQVELVDVNLLAVAAAGENIMHNGIAQARAFASDGVPEGAARRYDLVVSNPPFHVGKSVDGDIARAFIERAQQALEPGGQLILVANQFLRYDQVLRATFEQVTCLASNRSYRVWSATNRAVV